MSSWGAPHHRQTAYCIFSEEDINTIILLQNDEITLTTKPKIWISHRNSRKITLADLSKQRTHLCPFTPQIRYKFTGGYNFHKQTTRSEEPQHKYFRNFHQLHAPLSKHPQTKLPEFALIFSCRETISHQTTLSRLFGFRENLTRISKKTH